MKKVFVALSLMAAFFMIGSAFIQPVDAAVRHHRRSHSTKATHHRQTHAPRRSSSNHSKTHSRTRTHTAQASPRPSAAPAK